jgi:hypothetical protein
MQIRTLEPHEVDLHREVRLRALADAPDSFGVVVSEVEAQPMSYWEELTRSVTEPGRHVMFLACEGDTVLLTRRGNPVIPPLRVPRVGPGREIIPLSTQKPQAFCLRLFAFLS